MEERIPVEIATARETVLPHLQPGVGAHDARLRWSSGGTGKVGGETLANLADFVRRANENTAPFCENRSDLISVNFTGKPIQGRSNFRHRGIERTVAPVVRAHVKLFAANCRHLRPWQR